MNLKGEEVKIKTRWRFTDAKLSTAWLCLVRKLTANRKGKQTSTHPDATEGKCKDGNEEVPD